MSETLVTVEDVLYEDIPNIPDHYLLVKNYITCVKNLNPF